MKGKTKDIFIIGFALFSMFFGAGNVIFPPHLGMQSGAQWLMGFACYYLADIGLALVALFAMLKCGSTEGITRRVGRIPSAILMTAIVLCIGPMLAIPRTGATTFELSIQPLFSGVSPVVFSIVFFALILALCIRESAVVDIVGKFLTPALFLGLLLLIAVGVFQPLGPIAAEAKIADVPASGIFNGYQTMDVLATLVFGLIILKSAESKGYRTAKDSCKVVAGAGVVAAVGLLVVYLGLTYLGATASTLFDEEIDRSTLVLSIVEGLLGRAGLVIFGIVVGLACVTTAVGLTSAAASYFVKLGKFLTPALFLGLLLLIAVGVFQPLGPIAAEAKIADVPASGIFNGYQTMDVLATLVFGLIILKSAESKGYRTAKDSCKVVAGAGVVAAVGLLVVYLGLTYLGATASTLFDEEIDRSTLVLSIVEGLLGRAGLVIFGIVVGLACVTTAVGLTSAAASYFVKLFKGRISYQALVIFICVCSAVLSNFGLDQIVSIASPILSIVYPPTLVLIILAYFGRRIRNNNVCRMAALGALLFSILETLNQSGVSISLVERLPLAALGFGWVVPALVFGLLGALLRTPGSFLSHEDSENLEGKLDVDMVL